MPFSHLCTWTALAVIAIGCQFPVSRDAYQRDLAALKGQQDQLEAQKQALASKVTACEGDLAGCRDKLQSAARDQSLCADELKNTKAMLDQCANRGGTCAKDLVNCQIAKNKADDDLRRATAERDRLQRESKALADSLARIQEGVKKVQNRLKDLVAAGKLRIRERHGLLVIEVASDILFDLNKAEVKAAARPVLADIADALKSLADRRFQVAGHTDNTGADAINWRLSVDRALAVLAEMTALGVGPNNLSAAGFGPYLPVVANDSDANRARNRRVEFLLIPDLGELFRLGL
ncbi:MAG: OmpA family protein [Deltaproteobacteria bacterium]|nr:OmpA family protein [Deltaproteobacteria bacterium]